MERNTRERILSAFMELEKEKSVEKITVKDIVERSCITRKTFYYHFKDIYDVCETIMSKEAENIFAEIMDADSPEKGLYIFFKYMAENQKRLRQILLYHEPLRKMVVGQIYQLFNRLMEEKQVLSNVPRGDAEMAVRIFTYAVIGISMEGRMKTDQDIEREVKQLFTLLKKNL